MIMLRHTRTVQFATLALAAIVAAACNSESTTPLFPDDTLVFTAARVSSLDSTAQVIKQTNATNPELESLVDSTLLVFTAGIEAKRVDVTTNLTTAPLYFVGIHRAVTSAAGSYSTWTLVGMDDPTNLTSIVEVSGFAQNSVTTAPTTVAATIGDGTGFVNAQMLHVATGGVVTQYRANTGSASFASGTSGAACPGFTPTALVTCTMETMHVHFTVSSADGALVTSASVPSDVDVPTMRLNYSR
jgi:hypothetical protein